MIYHLKKIATQSSTMSFVGSGAYNAIDRNISTCSRTNDIGETSQNKIVWWKVYLGGAYSIYSINILFKNYDVYDFGLYNFYHSFFMIQSAVKKYACYSFKLFIFPKIL